MSVPEQRPVRASDRIDRVLARDERLMEIVAGRSPSLARLRVPGLRRIMARLMTVAQAARLGDTEPDLLVAELNRALGIADADASPTPTPDRRDTMPAPTRSDAPFVELDVRDDLRNGREPFSRIMATVAALNDGEGLCLRATFEPVPLFTVMQMRGYGHRAEELGPDDWRVWFFPEGEAGGAAADAEAPKAGGAAPSAPPSRAREVVLDVRGLEPPEPMQRTLEALNELPPDAVLIQENVRVPHFLLPILRERGFDYEVREPGPGRVVVCIWRATPANH